MKRMRIRKSLLQLNDEENLPMQDEMYKSVIYITRLDCITLKSNSDDSPESQR